MSKVHMILQGKGGIGKSFVAAILAQFLKSKDENTLVIDIDQENPTLGHYEGLGAMKISVMGEGRTIDPKKFDGLMIAILEHQGDVVVDTGANTFSALLAYAIENSAFQLIEESGKTLVIHSIIGGGDTLLDTLHGFTDLAQYIENEGGIVVWQNAHFGALESSGGVKLSDAKAYKAHASKIKGEILLERRNAATFGSDINRMCAVRMTFDEVMASDKFNLLEKNRLKIVRKSVFDQLDALSEAEVI